MKVNITLDTNRLSLDNIAQIVASADCSNRRDCSNCPLCTSPVILKNDKVETTCMSLYIDTKVNVNKL